jgi:RNA polymerase sigma-70 factor (ECF subfamily)
MLRAGQGEGDVRLPLAGSSETEEAWAEFHVRLQAFVSRRVRQPADAEDIVQNVFLNMQRSLPTLRARDHLGAWLYRVARNAIVDHYRTPARRREVPSGDTRDLEGPDPAPATVGHEVSDKDFAGDCLRPMVQRLPDDYRRALELVELGGHTQAAAAAREQISLSGMKSRVQRARRQLKTSLLQCCKVAVDARGAVMSCEAHRPTGAGCGAPNGRSKDTHDAHE